MSSYLSPHFKYNLSYVHLHKRQCIGTLRKITLNSTCSRGLVKKYWWDGGRGGPEKRGSGSLVFEPLASGSSNFQLPIWVGHPVLYQELVHI